MSPTLSISPIVWDVLSRSTLGDNTLVLPPGQLDRKTYEAVNKVLEILGGKWTRSAGAHVFKDSPGMALAEALESGAVTDPVKLFQWYPTPDEVADILIQSSGLGADFTGTILEPSAGDGPIIKAARRRAPLACFDVCEVQDRLLPALAALDARLVHRDFLDFHPAKAAPLYPFILANPPFTKGQGVRHADHMLDLLAPGGTLACILDAGVNYRQDRATNAFIERLGAETTARFQTLPSGAFKSSGTLVSTVILVARRHSA